MRSVYGMCECTLMVASHLNKSMVVAQFTGVSQKDENAFVKYNSNVGAYEDSTISGNEALSADSVLFINQHIQTSISRYPINHTFTVSCFAVGFAEHFVTDTGGDMSLTGSNSNFAKSLVSSGFRDTSFDQDDLGFITHVIPPKIPMLKVQLSSLRLILRRVLVLRLQTNVFT